MSDNEAVPHNAENVLPPNLFDRISSGETDPSQQRNSPSISNVVHTSRNRRKSVYVSRISPSRLSNSVISFAEDVTEEQTSISCAEKSSSSKTYPSDISDIQPNLQMDYEEQQSAEQVFTLI